MSKSNIINTICAVVVMIAMCVACAAPAAAPDGAARPTRTIAQTSETWESLGRGVYTRTSVTNEGVCVYTLVDNGQNLPAQIDVECF